MDQRFPIRGNASALGGCLQTLTRVLSSKSIKMKEFGSEGGARTEIFVCRSATVPIGILSSELLEMSKTARSEWYQCNNFNFTSAPEIHIDFMLSTLIRTWS